MPIRNTLAIMCLTLATGIAGCGDALGPVESLDAARDMWRQANLQTYTMTMRISCECNVDQSGPVVARVRNGSVESLRYVSSGELVPLQYAGRFRTVEELFDMVEVQLRRDLFVSVEYHRELGYPARTEFPGIAQQDVYTVSILTN